MGRWAGMTAPLTSITPLATHRLTSPSGFRRRYQSMLSAPSNDTMHTIWSTWSTLFFLFGSFNTVILLGVLSSRQVRKKPFNLYLIFLMIPDILMTIFCAIQCALLASNGGYRNQLECYLQSVYLIFGVTANAWLNLVIIGEIYYLVRYSNRRQRYFPPSRKAVARKSLGVYCWALSIGIFGILSISGVPHRTITHRGLLCMPGEYSRHSTVFFWTSFFPLVVAIPLVVSLCIMLDIMWNQLIPPVVKRENCRYTSLGWSLSLW